jgi:preprotein translocase subunit SecY
MQKEGEQGQKKINKITRWLALPLAFVQSYGMILLLNNLAGGSIINTANRSVVFTAMLVITT